MPTKDKPDPKSYVQISPLPISSQKGLKIQARSIEVYNPTEPARDVVRKQNYQRRSAQMSSQGFRSANHRPYHGIGDPFYLDEKKLILHALGQWDESQEWETSSSSEDDDAPTDSANGHAGQMSAAKFVLRRTRKDLNTLSKEVVKGRHMIRNVRLGHGLFDLIRQERMAKKNAAAAEKQKKLEMARNMWQPPKRDSESEEESEDETMQDDYDSAGDNYRRASAPAVRASSARKKKAQTPRPYTPQHTSLWEMSDCSDDESTKPALFRQLCVLSWILDAMNLEQGYTMSPIMTCWSHNEIGGTKISTKKVQEEKKAETRWERFLSQPMPGRIKKVSTVRARHPRQSLRLLANPRASVQSTSPSPSSSSSAVNLAAGFAAAFGVSTGASHREDTIHEEEKATPVSAEPEEDAQGTAYSKSMFKFLDEYYDSLRRETKNEEEGQGKSGMTPAATERHVKSHDPERRARKERKKSKEREKTPDRSALYDMQEALGVPRGMRADKFVKPKPSAELLEFHEKKASNKYLTLSVDLANKFKEVQDDKAMTLHDILEQMERERLTKCQSKFMVMQTSTSSVYRAMEAMRREGERRLQKPAEEDMRRKSSFRGNWFTDLLENIPQHLRNVWYYQAILNKLRKYGLVESTSKQSVYKFLKVLEGLREWEICSPDIAAAIEFCRERIVDLSIEEYEEWFASVFPRVNRPQTAPPGLRGDKEKKESHAPPSTATPVMKGKGAVRQVQSAFVRRSQR
ncbi:hypothetical protein BaRGS_00019320 [Batillaria attramentaria]|uniref:Coiled-coil domain-containing protein 60 n=1 Tax=Batillaria attramentaria TaxID=370345 RepID=A0ABD0KQL3_9CAEN